MAMQKAGHRYAARRTVRGSVASSEGPAAVEAALFAPLGLLLALTLSGAQTRADDAR